MRQLQILFLFLLLICICTTATIGFHFTTCKEAERTSLLKFKGSFFLDPSNRLGSWVGQDCCNWKGVGCDNVTGNVIKLDMGGDQYPLPNFEVVEVNPALIDLGSDSSLYSLYLKAREVNPALLELKYLTYLDLSFIDFNGSRFPEFFGSMRQLQHLNLSSTHFSGKLPRLLGNLTELVVLDLRHACSWNCELERNNSLEWAFKLENLKYLDLSWIDLSQALDSLNLLHKLPSLSVLNLAGCSLRDSHQLIRNSTISSSPLQHLDLQDNNFIGPIPHFIQNLSSIRFLDLSFNGLNSPIPPWLGNKVDLRYLSLSFNSFSGPFPHFIQRLSFLTHLDLSCNQFSSSIPTWLGDKVDLRYLSLSGNNFNGSFPHFIQRLSFLTHLDLSFNQFSSSIPPWLGDKVDLRYLSLSGNNFNGSFPHFIQRLSFLTHLDLSFNQFSSSIPSWLANKTYLEYLDLSVNNFNRVDGGITSIIVHLCRLRSLDLSFNQLQEEVSEEHVNFSRCSKSNLEYLNMQNTNISGYLPMIGSLSSLLFLDLSHNNIETLPPSLGGLLSLTNLDLSYNNLSVVPPAIGNLSSLHILYLSHNILEILPPSLGRSSSLMYLDLSYNKFSVVSPIIGNLSSLEHLDLSHNNLSVVHQVSLANLSSLRYLDISSNSLILDLSPDWMPPFQLESLGILPCKLNSPFPNWVLSQVKLWTLDLSDTGIFGPLPDNIGNAMPSLLSLQLASNHINGSIPRSLCGLTGLHVLDLQKNRLSGLIPDCWADSQLFDMDLSSNRLSGPIPNSLLKASHLELLSLNNNSIEGELPLSMSSSTTLRVLDVGKNNLHGEIPAWNGSKFPSLQVIILRENRFKGRIPLQLCSFYALKTIDLASNNLSGGIPQCFGHFKGMEYTTVSTNSSVSIAPTDEWSEWSAVEVIKGEAMEYTTVLHLLVNMDLSCNHLVGVIPAELTSLSLLFSLNLSHNHLNGTIPKEMGKMKSLESLDLSFNNLSGLIPESISSLDTLSTMNLSFNNLHGQIPTGRHFQTLDDPSIYMGNPGLCGDPLPKCYGGDTAHPPTSTVLEDEEEDDKHEKLWFYLVIMLGFATGFWGVIGMLVVNKNWRHAYFGIAEELADWIYVKVAVRIARANSS